MRCPFVFSVSTASAGDADESWVPLLVSANVAFGSTLTRANALFISSTAAGNGDIAAVNQRRQEYTDELQSV